jgi:myosin heavy subunit
MSVCLSVNQVDLQALGFDDRERNRVLAILSAVLLLGNLRVHSARRPHETHQKRQLVEQHNQDISQCVCKLLDISISEEELQAAKLGVWFASDADDEHAIALERDRLACLLYEELLAWIQSSINARLQASDTGTGGSLLVVEIESAPKPIVVGG